MRRNNSQGDLLQFEDSSSSVDAYGEERGVSVGQSALSPRHLPDSERSRPLVQSKFGKSRQVEEEILHKAIVECYMILARATRQEDLSDVEQVKEEKRLKKLSNIVMVDYIRGMCEILHNQVRKSLFKDDKGVMNQTDEIPLTYEKSIQSLEAQVRSHFSIQNQLKLHIEITEGENESQIKVLTNQLEQQEVILRAELKEELR